MPRGGLGGVVWLAVAATATAASGPPAWPAPKGMPGLAGRAEARQPQGTTPVVRFLYVCGAQVAVSSGASVRLEQVRPTVATLGFRLFGTAVSPTLTVRASDPIIYGGGAVRERSFRYGGPGGC